MFTFQKENLHHAYLIPGDGDIFVHLLDHLQMLGMPTHGNPDFFHKEVETFSIDDAREVKAFQGQSALTGGKKVIVMSMNYFSHPAQHALLKVFEDPASNVHFFIITKQVSVLLPTLMSRLITLPVEILPADAEIEKEVKSFLDGEKEDRLSMATKIVKRFDKEETSIPLKTYAIKFLNQLEVEIASRADKHLFDVSLLWRVKDYIHDQGSSVKNLLETLALTLDNSKDLT